MRTRHVRYGELQLAVEPRTRSVARLLVTRDPSEVEQLADALATESLADGWTGRSHRQLVEALLLCLSADTIRDDADAEDALCSALSDIGVMRRVGNLLFEFAPDGELEDGDRALVARYRAWLPSRYSPSRRAPRRTA